MSQRSFFLVAVLLLLLLTGVAATLMALVRQEPAWYTAAAMAPGPERTVASKAFYTEFSAMYNSLKYDDEPFVAFSDVQTNSFFEEDFLALRYDRELALDNIRVNAVAPGVTATPASGTYVDEDAERDRTAIAMGRRGTPEEQAGAILFLLSDLSSYVTGQTLLVDGGISTGAVRALPQKR